MMVIPTVDNLRVAGHKDRVNLFTKTALCIKAVGSMAWSKGRD